MGGVIMEELFLILLDEFSVQLSKPIRNNYIPILRKFIISILDKHKNTKSIDKLLENEITPDDIINAGKFYIESTDKVTGTKAVDKYLTAVSEFYNRIIFNRYPMCNLLRFRDNFQEFRNDIIDRCNKDLKDSEAHKHLSKADYKIVMNYLNYQDRDTYKEKVNKVIFKLILLYGFKIGIISNIKKSDFSTDRNTIVIRNDNEPIILELPYSIAKEINYINNQNALKSDYLFLTEDGQIITSAYVDDELKNISRKINVNANNKFTTTSFSKYAVIEMFVKGMNPLIISQISGMKDVNLKYCQYEANKRLNDEFNVNRYVNSKLRGISTYDDFN